ncbi:DUF262 domain-containing protein [Specibacter sp. NPDC057265]|uniref:GmrSD restriction endonuclease domain-containing protein n=1 Tax=Specibacter sp. NPDC057265 TaxID=3346075 RepID=UPI00363A0292
MSDPITIDRIISRVQLGELRIPGFQRNFVWEPQQAALLMDSIFKGFPFGSVLLWRTANSLRTEQKLGGFTLPPPAKQYPIDYVLDGQQRITSIFATFQNNIASDDENPEVWLPIYYDFEAAADAQESRFVALSAHEVDLQRHFPLKTFFSPVAFSRHAQSLSEPLFEEIVKVQQRFVTTLIPVQTFESEDRTSVAIVFERVNRLGVELNMFQLLTAWTWSEDFDLQQEFNSLSESFDDFGFGDVGSDNDLMLRCCSAILVGDPSPTALINVNGAEVRASFATVSKALELSVDFLRRNLLVRHLKFLPYQALLIPLAAYFSKKQSDATPDIDRQVLLRWFWRTSFSHRYSGNPLRSVRSDVEEAIKLRNGEPSTLDDIKFQIGPSFFMDHAFRSANVASKCLILLLAAERPKTFLSGEEVDLDQVLSEPNRKEYHHCFPRQYLIDSGITVENSEINRLANLAFISRVDNRTILAKAPSTYRSLMPTDTAEIQKHALLPDSLFTDDWDTFCSERAQLLSNAAAQRLM